MYQWWKRRKEEYWTANGMYKNDEREEKKNIELLMECIRMMYGKYRTQNANRYEQRTM